MDNLTEERKNAILAAAVRTAEEVTEESIERPVIELLREHLSEPEQARILDLYDDGVVAEQTARQLLGDEKFTDAVEKKRGTEAMLSGDSSRFIMR
ncbi:hypothetical protein [Halovenus sp. HT40]|uniref:hypothetical protein n=1 Tax=Halovenus sp. HT40 TaxID=3126691 RepID=UPI00300E895B